MRAIAGSAPRQMSRYSSCRVSGLRWTFYGTSDVNIWLSFGITIGFLTACIAVIAFIFKTGWRLRT